MLPTKLFNFQIQAIDSVKMLLKQSYASGDPAVPIIYMPTGAGKTIVACKIIEMMLLKKPNTTAVFAVNRLILINQTLHKLADMGIRANVVQGNNTYVGNNRVTVLSAQSLGRFHETERISSMLGDHENVLPDILIIDECHEQNKKLIEFARRMVMLGKIVIGLSATPITNGLFEFYTHVINVITTNKLIKNKVLSPLTVFTPDRYKTTTQYLEIEKHKNSNEITDNTADNLARCIVGDTVIQYLKLGRGRKFIVCGCSIAHCRELQSDFNKKGIRTELFTSDIDDRDRQEVMREFKTGESIRGLIAVNSLIAGFDYEELGCIIMTRIWRRSLAAYIQALGRVMRGHKTKSEAIVIDMVGNWPFFYKELQSIFEYGIVNIEESLMRDAANKKKKDKPNTFKSLKKCRKCKAFSLPNKNRACPFCGTAYPVRKTGIVTVPGDYHLAENVKSQEFEELNTEQLSILRQLKTEQETRGYKVEWISDIFFCLYGKKLGDFAGMTTTSLIYIGKEPIAPYLDSFLRRMRYEKAST